MQKAYDTYLQSNVSADSAAKNCGIERNRYECVHCEEEVRLAAVGSTKMMSHFRHRSGNNDKVCENYLGQYGAINTDFRSRKNKNGRAEFYFDNNTKMFYLGLRFNDEEIKFYEQSLTTFELRTSAQGKASEPLKISYKNFSPDVPTMIPIEKFSNNYFLFYTHNNIKREEEVFSNNGPTFFKILSNDSSQNRLHETLSKNRPITAATEIQQQEASFELRAAMENTVYNFITTETEKKKAESKARKIWHEEEMKRKEKAEAETILEAIEYAKKLRGKTEATDILEIKMDEQKTWNEEEMKRETEAEAIKEDDELQNQHPMEQEQTINVNDKFFQNNYKAKLVRSEVLYTNVPYFVVFQGQFSDFCLPNDMKVDDSFKFYTMNRNFLGKCLTIKNKTNDIDALLSSWGYKLEASETLTLLWPPAVIVDDITLINSDYSYLYSSFELSFGNINVPENIKKIINGIFKVSVKSRVRVYKKNAEMVIDKDNQNLASFDNLSITEMFENIYTVPENNTHFLFNRSGVVPLSKGQSVPLISGNVIRHYHFGYLKSFICPKIQSKLTNEQLLNDILAHYKRTEVLNSNDFDSLKLSETVFQYIKSCEASGFINSAVKHFIEEGRL